MRKIDVFTHIWPQPFLDALIRVTGDMSGMTRRSRMVPMMTDLAARFKMMDQHEGYCQILSLASPPLELHATPEQAVELSRIGSDAMAELCRKYPDRFPGFIASAPISNPDKVIDECERAIKQLGACGVQIYTNVAGVALDHPDFAPFFDYMAEVDLPVWLHPARGPNFTDYLSEKKSLYEIWWTLGWPYETSVAMARLVFSKTLQRLPNLKIITHHAGGMIPYFEGRVGPGWDQLGVRTTDADYFSLYKELGKRPIDYFKRFYADTAVFGARTATLYAIEFFGVDHVLFASDAPFDPEGGTMFVRETIKLLDGLDIAKTDLERIYHGNAIRLLKLQG